MAKKESKSNVHVDKPMQEFYHNPTNTHIGLTKRMGTPAHGTYLSKGEYDDRRHRSRCINYDKKQDVCTCVKGYYYLNHCCGSAQCNFYEEKAVDKPVVKEQQVPIKQSNPKPNYSISYNDKIKLYCYEDKEYLYINMKSESEELPLIQQKCLGKTKGYKFCLSDYNYKIEDFTKHS